MLAIRTRASLARFPNLANSNAYLIYSVRNASIGDIRMAFIAGYSPKPTPSSIEKKTDISAHCGESTAGHSGTIFTIRTAICAIPLLAKTPSPIPNMPPVLHRIIDSLRNCNRISERFAPHALRSPISRVRSPTTTSIMFIMPIPPTRSEKPAILPNAVFMNVLIFMRRASPRRTSKVPKKSSLFRCRFRMTALTSSIARGRSSTVCT